MSAETQQTGCVHPRPPRRWTGTRPTRIRNSYLVVPLSLHLTIQGNDLRLYKLSTSRFTASFRSSRSRQVLRSMRQFYQEKWLTAPLYSGTYRVRTTNPSSSPSPPVSCLSLRPDFENPRQPCSSFCLSLHYSPLWLSLRLFMS